ncbi:MAG: hypothetical protein V1897_02060 [Pseudomonadota bacterium]
MEEGKTTCVTCAWRSTCNKKFQVDGSTTTRCLDYTRDLMLGRLQKTENEQKEPEKDSTNE